MKKIRLLAFILAVLTAGALFYYLNMSPGEKKVEIPKSNVIIAAADIPQNTVITEEMLKLASVPTETVLPNTYSTAADIIGKTTSANIVAGEQIVDIRLVEVGSTENGLAYAVTEGMRAITIGVGDTSSLKYMIKPNDIIDIIGQYQIEMEVINLKGEPEEKTIPTARLLMQHIKVLAVDQVMLQTGAPQYTTLTLEVTPEQAVELSYSENAGLLRAMLRSPLDTEDVAPITVTIKEIMS